MFRTIFHHAACFVALACAWPVAASAQDIDFGDDTSEWALDGECDDKRFEGSGMASPPLLDADVGHDATDCRVAYEQDRLVFVGAPARPDSIQIQWGDDEGDWANDGECDDMRFEGPGMTATTLLETDVKHDATDCRTAYEQGLLNLRGHGGAMRDETPDWYATPAASLEPVRIVGAFDWGDNSSQWANDGECDDLRFAGEALSSVPMPDDIGRDEQDCRSAYDNGLVGLNPLFRTPGSAADIEYGDDAGDYANDGECDDLRFTGGYASAMIYLVEDIGHDASDCRAAVDSGEARWQADSLPYELGMTLEATATVIEDSLEEI